MEVKDQICSLELSKRLKECGVKQESIFLWSERPWKMRDINIIDEIRPYLTLNPSNFPDKSIAEYSAFTVSELGNILPSSINEWGLTIHATSCVVQDKILNLWHIQYADDCQEKALMSCVSDLNLSNAMAKMLIYLLENKLFVLEE